MLDSHTECVRTCETACECRARTCGVEGSQRVCSVWAGKISCVTARALAVGYRAATYMHGHRSVPGRELRLGQGLCRDWMMIGNPTRVHVTGGDCRIIMLA